MRVRDLFYETWQALSANKGRSLLTILGIVIGISAVIAMTALIGGIKNSLVSELGLNQSRVIYMYVMGSTSPTYADLDLIKESVPGYEYVTASVTGSAQITTGSKSSTASVNGVKPEYFEVSGNKLAQGRYFTAQEEQAGSMMAVLDQTSVKTLFGSDAGNVVGRTVHLGNDDYTVIGVVESTSMSSMGLGGSVTIYLPYTTARTRVVGANAPLGSIIGYAQEGTDVEDLASRTTDFLMQYYKIPQSEKDQSLMVMTMQSLMTQMDTMMTAFQALMVTVASISLFVGGIGIMNMMLTNVTERIREIGLRKALGARRSAITRQFLLEAVMLCVIGGIVGILFGYLGAWVLALGVRAVQPSLASIAPAITPGSVLFAVGVCVAIGVVFGYYPARRAARMNPVESLRYQ